MIEKKFVLRRGSLLPPIPRDTHRTFDFIATRLNLMRKSLLVYIVVLVVFALGLILTLERGRHLQRPSQPATPSALSPVVNPPQSQPPFGPLRTPTSMNP